MYEGLIQKEAFHTVLTKDSVLIPIPLHISKERARGYNHAKLLAMGIAKKLELPLQDCLLRVKKTTSQFALTKLDRQQNIKNAFVVKKAIDRKYSTIFLVDDVLTSGTTLSEAAKILKKQGVKKVYGITLAHGH